MNRTNSLSLLIPGIGDVPSDKRKPNTETVLDEYLDTETVEQAWYANGLYPDATNTLHLACHRILHTPQ
jgi:hypothetical protein